MDKDEHPVRWLLENFDDKMTTPLSTWLDGLLQQGGLGSFWDDSTELPVPR